MRERLVYMQKQPGTARPLMHVSKECLQVQYGKKHCMSNCIQACQARTTSHASTAVRHVSWNTWVKLLVMHETHQGFQLALLIEAVGEQFLAIWHIETLLCALIQASLGAESGHACSKTFRS